MFSSLKLGRPFGIDLFVHPTFWVLPVLIFASSVLAGDPFGAVMNTAVVFALFACVALHEFGHALAARAYGIRTRHITLYPIGGVAALERMPTRPAREIAVALAGPAVNVAIAAGLLVVIIAANVVLPTSFSFAGMSAIEEFLVKLFGINVALVLFNLLPAFPMDGGRVFRALLNMLMPRLEATRWAVAVGTVMAGAFVLSGLGLFAIPLMNDGANFSLVLVGIVVYFLGRAELGQVEAAEVRRVRERRSSDEFESAFAPPIAEVIAAPRFTGWRFDPERRTWSEWRDGHRLREVPAL